MCSSGNTLFRRIQTTGMLIVLVFLQSCLNGIPQDNENAATDVAPLSLETISPAVVQENKIVSLATFTLTPFPVTTIDVSTLPLDFWMELPVVPDGVSDNVREIYRRGSVWETIQMHFRKLAIAIVPILIF